MAKTDKIKELDLFDLIKLRNEVDSSVRRIRANFEQIPTMKFNKFNSLLGFLNNEIERRIENEYLE